MTDPNRADLELPARVPFSGWDVDSLDALPPEPAPRRRFGCAWLTIAVLAVWVGWLG